MQLETKLLLVVQALAIFTFVGFIFLIFLPQIHKNNSVKKYFFKDKKALFESLIFIFFYLFLFSQLFILNKNHTEHITYMAGATIAIGGLLIAFLARLQLKHVWSPITNTQVSKEILDRGAFGITRHPVYIGRLLFFAGTMLMLNLSGVFVTIFYWYLLRKKATEEEQYLIKNNPKYKDYIKHVKGLF